MPILCKVGTPKKKRRTKKKRNPLQRNPIYRIYLYTENLLQREKREIVDNHFFQQNPTISRNERWYSEIFMARENSENLAESSLK